MPTHILVVDDEPDLEALIRQRFRKRIRDAEYAFHFAPNGKEALQRIQAHDNIEVVLTDLNMPEMDGITLLERLGETGKPLKAVVISAYGDMDNIRTAMNRGAFDFVTKPIDFRDLELTLEKTIRELEHLKSGARAHDRLVAMEHELNVAARIQRSFVPRMHEPCPGCDSLELYAAMTPARSVGGDFYDYFFVDEHRFGFLVGDVSGKGVPAALFMAVCRTLFKAIALSGEEPAACLQRVNELLLDENDSGMFVTLFYGLLDIQSGALEFSNAGHNPPYLLLENASPAALPNQGGVVLGVLEDQRYETGRAMMRPGDVIFLFTDGVTEAGAPDKEFYGESRLEAFLDGKRGLPPKTITGELMADIRAFAGEWPPHDDITALALRFAGTGPPDA